MPRNFSEPVLTLQQYVRSLRALGDQFEEHIATHELDNELAWLWRLDEIVRNSYDTFHQINRDFFRGELLTPEIVITNRATGGFYDAKKNRIGLSLAMIVEHGEEELRETLLHEIAHMKVLRHDARFYELLTTIGGTGRKAPMTEYLRVKRKNFVEEKYPVRVKCPSCGVEGRYRTKRALRYACKRCCNKLAGGKFDERFRFVPA